MNANTNSYVEEVDLDPQDEGSQPSTQWDLLVAVLAQPGTPRVAGGVNY